jgi:hypothetical protein
MFDGLHFDFIEEDFYARCAYARNSKLSNQLVLCTFTTHKPPAHVKAETSHR